MEQIEQSTIVATLVPEYQRLAFLPRHFDTHMMVFERQLYSQMRHVCADYDGGWWNFYDLSNGGCYLSPSAAETFRIRVPGNDFEGTLSADATGVTVTLFTLSHVAFRFPSCEVFTERFHQLRDFACEHVERRLILAAID